MLFWIFVSVFLDEINISIYGLWVKQIDLPQWEGLNQSNEDLTRTKDFQQKGILPADSLGLELKHELFLDI